MQYVLLAYIGFAMPPNTSPAYLWPCTIISSVVPRFLTLVPDYKFLKV